MYYGAGWLPSWGKFFKRAVSLPEFVIPERSETEGFAVPTWKRVCEPFYCLVQVCPRSDVVHREPAWVATLPCQTSSN